jgi:hypothetical protein
MTRKATAELVPASPPSTQPAAVSEAAAIFSMIERVAAQPDVPVERVEQLFKLYTQMDAERARRSYHAAFAAMQPQLPAVARKGTAHNNKAYARFEDIIGAIMPVLAAHQFGLSFRVFEQPGKVVVRAILSHSGGHSESTEFAYPFDASGNKNAIQAIGSATQYGKRYTASALLGIATKDDKDDDGNAAGTGETISEAQYKELADLLRDTGTDMDEFLKLGNLESLSDMPANTFAKAKGWLLAKKRGKQ